MDPRDHINYSVDEFYNTCVHGSRSKFKTLPPDVRIPLLQIESQSQGSVKHNLSAE